MYHNARHGDGKRMSRASMPASENDSGGRELRKREDGST